VIAPVSIQNSERVHVVFVGPTLSYDEARALHPDALILPPARVGDIASVMLTYRPHAIGLIDGVFRNTMAVFHKEILDALSQGAWVLGASGMGALRAAECARYGMIGVGEVYEMYASGTLEDDDEVAAVHTDADSSYRLLSDSMVTIRATLQQPFATGVVSSEEAALLIASQKARHFHERSFDAVIQTAGDELEFPGARLDKLRALFRDHRVDLKADDARLLLHTMRELPTGQPPIATRPMIEASGLVTTLMDRDRTVGLREGQPVTFDAVMRYVALNRPEHDALRRRAGQRQALLQMAHYLEIEPTGDQLLRSHIDLAARMGIPMAELYEWGRSVDLSTSDVEKFVYEEALLATVEAWSLDRRGRIGFVRTYLDELRLAGLYASLRDEAGEVEQLAKRVSVDDLSVGQTLAEHVARTGWTPPRHWGDFIRQSDLGDESEVFERLMTYVAAARARSTESPVTSDVDDDSTASTAEGLDPAARSTGSRGV